MKANYPDSLTIQQYLEGKLDPEVMHQLEKQALDDPFLWDALEGYSTYADPGADLSILQRQLHERIVHLQENKKVFDLTWQRLSVAAAAAVLFVAAGILFWMNGQKPTEQLASQSRKQVDVHVIDRDSLEAVLSSTDQPVIATLKKKELVLDRPASAELKPAIVKQGDAVSGTLAEAEVSEVRAANAPTAMVAKKIMTGRPGEASQNTETPVSVRLSGKVAGVSDADQSLNELVLPLPPKSGWPAYREYLRSAAEKFKVEPAMKGNVQLSFHVDSKGRPLDIKVVRGLNETYNREAIRIVKDGPEWQPPVVGAIPSPVLLEVSF